MSFKLSAKKKASKFISDDLLSTLESDENENDSKSKPSTVNIDQLSINEGKNIKDKKLSKLGVSDDLLASILDSETFSDVDSKKKKDKKKDKKKIDFTPSEESLVEEILPEPKDSKSIVHETLEEKDDSAPLDPSGLTIEQKVRREKPSSRVRFTESTQPGYVMMGLENVGLMYGNDVILKDATMMVQTGERVGLVGPNGGGKVT